MNKLVYNGVEGLVIGDAVVEAYVDNLYISIELSELDGTNPVYIAKMKELNYDSYIDFDYYTLDEYETEMLYNIKDCYDLLIAYCEDHMTDSYHREMEI